MAGIGMEEGMVAGIQGETAEEEEEEEEGKVAGIAEIMVAALLSALRASLCL